MKTFCLVVVALLGIVAWQYTTISTLTRQVAVLEARLKPVPAPAPRQAPRPTPQIEHLVCPLCKGLRAVLYNDGRKKDNCPLCVLGSGPVGYRDVTVDLDHQICPNCGGMGKLIVNRLSHPPGTENCTLCGGTGVVPRRASEHK